MSYSVIIPTHREPQTLLTLLQSLQQQTLQPTTIRIIYDTDSVEKLDILKKNISIMLTADIQKKIQIIHPHTDPNFSAGNGVSYVRNYGVSKVTTPYVISIDDDNTIDEDFGEKICDRLTTLYNQYHTNILLIPTEYYHGKIRSQGYIGFNFWIGAPIAIRASLPPVKGGIRGVVFSSSNCLSGHTTLFKKFPFDETMKFIYEDFDCTYRMTRAGNHAFVATDIAVYHHMQSKTPLENTYIATPSSAYQKARNRILFVKHVGTFHQKLAYFCCGLWIHTIFLITKIFFYAPDKKKRPLIRAIFRGTYDGFHT